MKHLLDKIKLDGAEDLFTLPELRRAQATLDPKIYPPLDVIVKNTILDRYVRLRRSKTDTARSLGITRATLYRHLDEYGVV